MRIPLVGSSYKGVSVALDSQSTRNLYEEFADSKEAAAPSALIATPGLSNVTLPSQSTNGPVEGLLELPRLAAARLHSLFVISQRLLYRIDCSEAAFQATGELSYSVTVVSPPLGFDTDYPPVMVDNTTIVLLVNLGGQYTFTYTIATQVLGLITVDATPTTFVPFIDAVHLAGYFVAFMKSGTGALHYIFYSANGIDWVSADFFQAEADSSELVKLIEKNGHLWVLKGKSIQVFAPTGNSNNPFEAIQSATIQKGCLSKASVQQIGNYIYFLGNDSEGSGFVVYRVAGGEAERVSKAWVEKILQDIFDMFGPQGIRDIVASNTVERGRNLYKLHCHRGKTTMVFDELTGQWHERGWWNAKTGEYEEEIGVIEANFNGKHVVGDRRSNLVLTSALPSLGLYEQSERYASNTILWTSDSGAHDAGIDTIIRRERISPQFSGPNGELLICGGVELLFETGKADANGQGSDPKVTLYISRDGGNTYGSGLTRSIGGVGKYKDRCTYSGLGSAYKFVFKIVMTDPIAWKLVSAVADLKVAA